MRRLAVLAASARELAPMRATLGLIRRMAREWKEKGTYATLEAYGVPFADLQQLFG